MIITTVTYNYSDDVFSVIAYDVADDVLRSATDTERMRLEQWGELADVFDTDSVLETESGEELDAWRECERLKRERGYAIVRPLGVLECASC